MRRPVKKLLTLVLTGALYPAARWWLLRWGAEASEIDAELPGDELIGNPTIVTTRAITFHASPEAIWPWLVQMGQDRGGLYSYDWAGEPVRVALPQRRSDRARMATPRRRGPDPSRARYGWSRGRLHGGGHRCVPLDRHGRR